MRRIKTHKNEIIPEECEDENDTLVELKSFKTLNIQKRKSNSSPRQTQNTLNQNSKEKDNTTNDDIDEDEECTSKPRMERFLSICEIPPEILLYQQEMQRKFGAGGGEANGSPEKNSKINNVLAKNVFGQKKKFPIKKNDFERIDKTKSFSTKFGNGLSQQVRAEIIKNIIKNFNLENYINQFKSNFVIEIELDKKY